MFRCTIAPLFLDRLFYVFPRVSRFVFILPVMFVTWAIYHQINSPSQAFTLDFIKQKQEITSNLPSHQWKEWLDESRVMPSYKWRELLDRSHLEPDIVADRIQKILKSKVDFTLLDYAYLNIILHNLSLYSEELWIKEAMGIVPQKIVQIEWMDLLLEAELALHIWHSSDKRIGYLLLEELLTNAELKKHAFLMPRLLNWAGSMALAEHELIEAQKYLLRSTYLSGLHNERLSQSKSHYNLAKMYLMMEQGKQALHHIQSARKIHNQLSEPDHSVQQLYWYNESVIQGKIGNIPAAKLADLQARKYFQLSQQTMRYQILDIRSQINIALLNKEYMQASSLIEQCISLSQREQFTYNLGRCYLKRSKLEVAKKNYSEAL
ncbi:hypothetical protein VSF3289_03528 [Vibrio scophthalmi]|uniref:Uncharacterized protein n=1 Tax=Vibrio scophthalmi TaxID=45658 RepID=A0A1E3WFT8_9VIBR|nr:hypothetical protein VSF3289_03528 [Vibrio scophthalmi]